MSTQIQYWWQSAYLSAILEFDPVMVSYRIDQATRIIEERMKMPPGAGQPRATGYSRRPLRHSDVEGYDNRATGLMQNRNSQFNQCPKPNRHIVAKDLNAPVRAVREKRKNRVAHTSHRNGRTSTIVRMVDSRSPARLDRWILWQSQCGQLLVMGPLPHRLVSFTVIVSGWSPFICFVWHSCELFIEDSKRNPMQNRQSVLVEIRQTLYLASISITFN
jgi:hypothetical protein